MTWVKIDDNAPLHPKLLDAGAEAAWLWVAGIAHANRNVTDGVIAKRHLAAVYPPLGARVSRIARRLVDLGLWIDEGDRYRIHDYGDYQAEALRDAVEERREQARERKRRERQRRRAKNNEGESPPSGDGHAVTGRDTSRVTSRDESHGKSRGSHVRGHGGTSAESGADERPDESQPPGPARPGPARPGPEGRPPKAPQGGGDHPGPIALSGEGALRQREKHLLAKHRATCMRLWDVQDRLREQLGRQRLKPTAKRVARVAAVLEAGADEAEAEAVLRHYADEAQRTGDTRWLNGETNWRPDNFDRALGMVGSDGGGALARGRNGARSPVQQQLDRVRHLEEQERQEASGETQ